MKPRNLLAILFVAGSLSACKKPILHNVAPPPPAAEEQEDPRPLLREVARVLEKVYENDSAWKEVNAAIFLGKYADERILLNDLIAPEKSGVFSRLFWDFVEEGEFPLLSGLAIAPKRRAKQAYHSADARLPANVVATNVAIYFPYSDLFSELTQPTIVTADREADQGPGREPYICTATKEIFCYRDVLVNDDYAASHPTHIVTVGADVVITPPAAPPGNATTRVYHGWSRLSQQLDKLISFTGNGGGSEMKICRINGYLNVSDQQVTNFKGDVATVYYTRSDIRNKRWKRVYSVWDQEWNYQDVEQIYAVYEEDTKGEKTFSGSLNTTLTVPKLKNAKVTGDIGYKISVMTQDEIVTQRKIGRKGYLKMSITDHGFGFLPDPNDFLPEGDWPIYDGGSIWSFTMPWQAM